MNHNITLINIVWVFEKQKCLYCNDNKELFILFKRPQEQPAISCYDCVLFSDYINIIQPQCKIASCKAKTLIGDLCLDHLKHIIIFK